MRCYTVCEETKWRVLLETEAGCEVSSHLARKEVRALHLHNVLSRTRFLDDNVENIGHSEVTLWHTASHMT